MNEIHFPTLSPQQMQRMLEPPSGKMRVVIDSDAKNEIDDQWALAWALASQDQLEIEGVYAAPFSFHHHRSPLLAAYEQLDQEDTATEKVFYAGSYTEWARRLKAIGRDPYALPFPDTAEGMEMSYREIEKVFALMGESTTGKLFRGSTRYLKTTGVAERSAATDHLIERAFAADDRPLFVVAIGSATTVANALLLEPAIVEKIVIVWTAAFPSFCHQCNRLSLNLVQDLQASQLLFECGAPLVYLPGFYIGEQLSISLPEIERWVQGQSAIGDYLHEIYVANPIRYQRGIDDLFGRSWVMWDLINIAWLLDPAWVPSEIVPTPILGDDMYWQHAEGRHPMREAISVNRDAIFRDIFSKLRTSAETT